MRWSSVSASCMRVSRLSNRVLEHLANDLTIFLYDVTLEKSYLFGAPSQDAPVRTNKILTLNHDRHLSAYVVK